MRTGLVFGSAGLAATMALAIAWPAAAQTNPCVELGQYIDPNGDDIWTAPPSNAAALDAANRCIAIEGGTANLYGIRAYIHRLMGNYDLADADATRRIEVDPSANSYRNRAIIRQNAGKHEEAIADLRVSLRRGYNRPAVVHQEIASSLRQLRRYSEALAAIETSASLDPGYEWALYERGRIFDDQERWDEAIGAWTRYIAMNSSNAQAYIYRSKAFLGLERWNDGLADADRAIQISPRNANAVNNRGFALHNLGRYGDSIAAFRRSIQLEPENAAGWDNLCSYLTDASDPAGALVACDRRESLAGTTRQDRARISSFRGLAYEALGDVPGAVRAFRTALSNPDAHAVTRERAEAGLLRLGYRN